MGVSLSSTLQIATSGMNINQLGLSTIAQNLANVNTEGYSRQAVQFSNVSYNGFGGGVQLETIQRFTDKFLTSRAVGQRADAGYNTTKTGYLRTLEGIFTSSGSAGSLDSQLTNFFNQISTLANSPDSSAQAKIVVQNAVSLSDTLRGMTSDLSNIASRVDERIDEEITTINAILKNISTLNKEISAQKLSGVSGANANDLEDERQRQVDELSSKFGLSITNNTTSGALRIATENGRTLVSEGGYVQLERTAGTPYEGIGYRNVQVDGSLSSTVISIDTSSLTSGSMKALVDVRDTVVSDLKAELETLADTIRVDFNKIHSRGTAFPAQRTLTSGNTSGLGGVGSDLYTDLSADLASDTMNISVVDASGAVIATTVGNGGAFAFPGGGPYSLTDLATDLNANVDVGGAITATATTDSDGNPVIQITANNAAYKIVLSNAAESTTNDPLGVLGMNNFFTGSGSGDMNVRSDIKADSNLIALARMRTTDGGVSSLDNQNALVLAGLSDATSSFLASGNLAAQTDTLTGYAVRISSDLALTIADSISREKFSDAILDETKKKLASVSGVSMDEELAQMLIYQNAFQASARIIRTVDELLQVLMQNL